MRSLIGLTLGACAVILLLGMAAGPAQAECPVCHWNFRFPPANGTKDGYPKFDIRIDGSWNVDNAGNPTPGQTNPTVWNALAGCQGCNPPNGAVHNWNTATGPSGSGLNYRFDLNQNSQSAAVTVIRDPNVTDCAVLSGPNGGPFEIRLPPSATSQQLSSLVSTITHELGHALGLANSSGCDTIMGAAGAGCMSTVAIQPRDVQTVNSPLTCSGQYPGSQISCSDSDGDGVSSCDGDCDDGNPSVTYDCGGGGGGGGIDCQNPESGNNSCPWSPVVVDVSGDGFKLTSGVGGVLFDLNGDGTLDRVSWTAAGADDSWLALDRNANGVIDDGTELFGNFTPQPATAGRNGFLALAEFDKPENGGNSNGAVDVGDAVYPLLRLWRDIDHDGTSGPDELQTLTSLSVESISLDYRESRRRDLWGNEFRYRAKLYSRARRDVGRWAYDIFLVKEP